MNLQMCICPWMLVWAKFKNLLASTLPLLQTQITSFHYDKWTGFSNLTLLHYKLVKVVIDR